MPESNLCFQISLFLLVWFDLGEEFRENCEHQLCTSGLNLQSGNISEAFV